MTTIIKRRSDEGDPSYTPQYDAILTIQHSNGERVTDADKTTYLMLSALCNNHYDDHYKYRNIEDLAKKLGLSPRALKERIARLRRIGWAGSGQWQWELVPVQTIMKFSTTAATHKRFAGPQQVEVIERKQKRKNKGPVEIKTDVETKAPSAPQETAPQEAPSADVPPKPKALEASKAEAFNPVPSRAEMDRRRNEEAEMMEFFEWLELPGDPRFYWEEKEKWGYANFKNRNSKPVSAPPVHEAQVVYSDDTLW